MKKHSIPEEPGSDTKLLIPDSDPKLWWKSDGVWDSSWTNGDDEYEWFELLNEFSEIFELQVPLEALKELKGMSMIALNHAQEAALKQLIEFVEAFK